MPERSTHDWDDIPPLKAPSRWLRGYLLGVVLFVVGILLGPVATIFSSAKLLSAPADAAVLSAPGEIKVDLREKGRMAVWHERRGIVRGTYESSMPELAEADLVLHVTDPSGNDVPMPAHPVKAFVDMGFITRDMLTQFDAPSPGTYVVRAELPPGKSAMLTVSKSPGPELIWLMVVSITFVLVGLALALAGVIVILVTATKQIMSGLRAQPTSGAARR